MLCFDLIQRFFLCFPEHVLIAIEIMGRLKDLFPMVNNYKKCINLDGISFVLFKMWSALCASLKLSVVYFSISPVNSDDAKVVDHIIEFPSIAILTRIQLSCVNVAWNEDDLENVT